MSKLIRTLYGFAALGVALSLSGCSDDGAATPFVPYGTATYVYTIQGTGTGVFVEKFDAGATGATVPVSSITLPTSFTPNALSSDSAGNLYVSGSQLNGTLSVGEVLVYSSNASGTAAPARTMTFNQTYVSMVVSGSSIYMIGYYGGISVFPATTSGAAMATRNIDGGLTTLDANTNAAVAVDGAGNIYAEETTPTGFNVVEFAAAASGNITPIRTLTLGGFTYGMAVDPAGNIYVSLNVLAGTSYGPGSIAVFGSGSTPTRSITVTGTTSSLVGGVKTDAAGNTYAVVSIGSAFEIVSVGSTQNGSVTPQTVMTSTSLSGAYPVIGIQ